MKVREDIRGEIIEKYISADGTMGTISGDILKIIDRNMGGENK